MELSTQGVGSTPERHSVRENGIELHWSIRDDGRVSLDWFGAEGLGHEQERVTETSPVSPLVELQVTGEPSDEAHSSKAVGTHPGADLRYCRHEDERGTVGRKVTIVQSACGLEVTSHLQLYDGIPTLRSWTTLVNTGSEAQGIEYVSSFAISTLTDDNSEWHQNGFLHIPHSSWSGEGNWRRYRLPELGLTKYNRIAPWSTKRLRVGSTGSLTSAEFAPVACFEDAGRDHFLFWQIEHNGSWQWEIAEQKGGRLYLRLSGPNEIDHHWWKQLRPGEAFESVPVSIGAVQGSVDDCFAELTRYRRAIRRPHEDNRRLPVVFNDFFHCLWADCSADKEIPHIEAAGNAGCEYYCIDAGWFGAGTWNRELGEWHHSEERFPGGMEPTFERIRARGMAPGLWIEIEVVSAGSRLARESPDSWFFVRRGKRVIANERLQLDFRNPDVIAHADAALDRLIDGYGARYVKIDYNVNIGQGTDAAADSPGEGLLEHNRAYLAWLRRAMDRHPEVIFENCGSGGLRANQALLSLHSIQSTSDQMDYLAYPSIAAAAPSLITPEQCAVWAYPRKDADANEVIVNMVNALLLRIHLSGEVAHLRPELQDLVKEGVDYYRTIRAHIPQALPFWPIGLPRFGDPWVSLGLRMKGRAYLAVWRLTAEEERISLPIGHARGHQARVTVGYPRCYSGDYAWNAARGELDVTLPERRSACVFELEW